MKYILAFALGIACSLSHGAWNVSQVAQAEGLSDAKTSGTECVYIQQHMNTGSNFSIKGDQGTLIQPTGQYHSWDTDWGYVAYIDQFPPSSGNFRLYHNNTLKLSLSGGAAGEPSARFVGKVWVRHERYAVIVEEYNPTQSTPHSYYLYDNDGPHPLSIPSDMEILGVANVDGFDPFIYARKAVPAAKPGLYLYDRDSVLVFSEPEMTEVTSLDVEADRVHFAGRKAPDNGLPDLFYGMTGTSSGLSIQDSCQVRYAVGNSEVRAFHDPAGPSFGSLGIYARIPELATFEKIRDASNLTGIPDVWGGTVVWMENQGQYQTVYKATYSPSGVSSVDDWHHYE